MTSNAVTFSLTFLDKIRPRFDGNDGASEFNEAQTHVDTQMSKHPNSNPTTTTQQREMKSNNADLFFFEELNRTVGREQSFKWLFSETEKLASPARSPARSPSRSPCRTPHVSPPCSPRVRSDHIHIPARKYSLPEDGGIGKHWSSRCRNATSMSTLLDDEIRSLSSSPTSPCSNVDRFSYSSPSLDLQRLASMTSSFQDDEHIREKLGLLFTDAAHAILD